MYYEVQLGASKTFSASILASHRIIKLLIQMRIQVSARAQVTS